MFIANNGSHKFDELENDAHVNVSFYNEKTTDWASYAGIAKISLDRELIQKYWSPMRVLDPLSPFISCSNHVHVSFRLHRFAGYFSDLGDGVHKGDANDPRVALIEVIPEEIEYWLSKHGVIGRTIELAAAAVTGKGHAPGELRTISQLEVCISVIREGARNSDIMMTDSAHQRL